MILPLSDELLCVLRIAGALYSPDGTLNLFRSKDCGNSWERQGPIRDLEPSGIRYNYADGQLTQLRDNSIVLRAGRWDMTDPDRFVINEETQGLLQMETCLFRSYDGARTWSDPVIAEVSSQFEEGLAPASIGGIVELDDNSWLQIFDSWKSYENPAPFTLNSFRLRSLDCGCTWRDKLPVADGSLHNRSYSHGVAVPRKDGRIMVSYWTAEPNLQKSFDLHTVTSLDTAGHRWGDPQPTGIPGQSSCALDMGGGRLLVTYSHRENTAQPGIKVVMSEDDGRTWQLDRSLVIWDAYGKESLGVARSATYPSSHDSIAYGAPRIVAIDTGHAIASFWCTQGADTHCRWCRIRLD